MDNPDPNAVESQLAKLQDALLEGRIDMSTYEKLKADLVPVRNAPMRQEPVLDVEAGGEHSAAEGREPSGPSGSVLTFPLFFLLIAVIAGMVGFGIVPGTAVWFARIIFLLFLVLFLVSLLAGARNWR